MKNIFRFLFAATATVWLLGAPAAALAQDEADGSITGFSNVSLEFYAEPASIFPNENGNPPLIIIEGEISSNVPPSEEPTDVSFIVPVDVLMYSAGYKDASGGYHRGYEYDGPPKTIPSEIPGWEIFTITIRTTHFVVEYYDPNVIAGDKDINISYQFRWLYPIINLTALVQVPERAKDFAVTPEGQSGEFEGYEYRFYQFQNLPFNGLETQQPIEFDISYSIGGGANPLLITGIIIGAFVIIAVIYFWRSSGSGGATRAERRRVPKRQQVRQETARPTDGAPAKFCRHCGEKLDRPSKFCPHCGGNI